MSVRPCDHLDDYLDGDLPADDTGAFLAHLADCPACRTIVREQQQIARLLNEASTQLDIVPARILNQVMARPGPVRWRRSAVMGGVLALAAAVLLTVGLVRKPLPPSTHDLVEAPNPAVVQEPPTPPSVRVTFAHAHDVIALPQPTTNPNVTILWVYPTVKIPAAAEAAPAESTSATERNTL